jgi:hypothetical protein
MQWLFTPILWHSARNPGPDDYDYSAMTPEQVKMLTAPFLFVRLLFFLATACT